MLKNWTSKLVFALVSVPAIVLAWFLPGWGQTAPSPNRTCAYNPDSGQPNPLGMRAFITATEQDGNTTFKFEQFPTPVGGSQPGVTIASSRELTFYGVAVEQASQLLLQNPNYYSELLGYEAPEGFAPVNAVLVCRSTAASNPQPTPTQTPVPSLQLSPGSDAVPSPQVVPEPQPTPSPVPRTESTIAPQSITIPPLPCLSSLPRQMSDPPLPCLPLQPRTTNDPPPAFIPPPPTFALAPPRVISRPHIGNAWISNLPDGNYRYWSGRPNQITVSDEDLTNGGGYVFVFNKSGDWVVGRLSRVDTSESMCVLGPVNGNTVSGFAYPGDARVTYLGENFTQWGPASYLQIRWGQRRGRQSRYDSALLNLNGFTRINAGTQMPPLSCP